MEDSTQQVAGYHVFTWQKRRYVVPLNANGEQLAPPFPFKNPNRTKRGGYGPGSSDTSLSSHDVSPPGQHPAQQQQQQPQQQQMKQDSPLAPTQPRLPPLAAPSPEMLLSPSSSSGSGRSRRSSGSVELSQSDVNLQQSFGSSSDSATPARGARSRLSRSVSFLDKAKAEKANAELMAAQQQQQQQQGYRAAQDAAPASILQKKSSFRMTLPALFDFEYEPPHTPPEKHKKKNNSSRRKKRSTRVDDDGKDAMPSDESLVSTSSSSSASSATSSTPEEFSSGELDIPHRFRTTLPDHRSDTHVTRTRHFPTRRVAVDAHSMSASSMTTSAAEASSAASARQGEEKGTSPPQRIVAVTPDEVPTMAMPSGVGDGAATIAVSPHSSPLPPIGVVVLLAPTQPVASDDDPFHLLDYEIGNPSPRDGRNVAGSGGDPLVLVRHEAASSSAEAALKQKSPDPPHTESGTEEKSQSNGGALHLLPEEFTGFLNDHQRSNGTAHTTRSHTARNGNAEGDAKAASAAVEEREGNAAVERRGSGYSFEVMDEQPLRSPALDSRKCRSHSPIPQLASELIGAHYANTRSNNGGGGDKLPPHPLTRDTPPCYRPHSPSNYSNSDDYVLFPHGSSDLSHTRRTASSTSLVPGVFTPTPGSVSNGSGDSNSSSVWYGGRRPAPPTTTAVASPTAGLSSVSLYNDTSDVANLTLEPTPPLPPFRGVRSHGGTPTHPSRMPDTAASSGSLFPANAVDLRPEQARRGAGATAKDRLPLPPVRPLHLSPYAPSTQRHGPSSAALTSLTLPPCEAVSRSPLSKPSPMATPSTLSSRRWAQHSSLERSLSSSESTSTYGDEDQSTSLRDDSDDSILEEDDDKEEEEMLDGGSGYDANSFSSVSDTLSGEGESRETVSRRESPSLTQAARDAYSASPPSFQPAGGAAREPFARPWGSLWSSMMGRIRKPLVARPPVEEKAQPYHPQRYSGRRATESDAAKPVEEIALSATEQRLKRDPLRHRRREKKAPLS